MQAHQVMPLRRLTQGIGQQNQLLLGQKTRHRTRHGGVQHRHAPVSNVHHRIEQRALDRRLEHHLRLIMVTGNPPRRRIDSRSQLPKRLVGLLRTVLGQVPGGEHQVNVRLLLEHQINDRPQTVTGIHAQQRGIGLGEQMAVRQLDQQRRIGSGQAGYARQIALSQAQSRRCMKPQLCWGMIERGNPRTGTGSQLPNDFELVAQRQAMTQPLAQEQVQLGFFIRLVH
ncbi:hypothetical protein D3C76_1038680 [compost metagenome]